MQEVEEVTHFSKAAIIDRQETEQEEQRKVALSAGHGEKTVPLRIDRKTIIMIRPGEDPEIKKAEFIKKLESRVN